MHYQLEEMRREGDRVCIRAKEVQSGFRDLETGSLQAFPGEAPCRAECTRISIRAWDKLAKRACRELARTPGGAVWAKRLNLPRSLGEEVAELVASV